MTTYDDYGDDDDLYEDEEPASPTNDSESLLRRAIDIIATARTMPLSSSPMINREEIIELLEEAAHRMPDELRQALDYLLTTVVVGLMVIFQPELRRGLMVLGRMRGLRLFTAESGSAADVVAEAAGALARDHVGAFAVAIHGSELLADRFAEERDDYRAIMVRALADRLAEAFAERLHERARDEWYAPGESRSNEELIRELLRYDAVVVAESLGTLAPLKVQKDLDPLT